MHRAQRLFPHLCLHPGFPPGLDSQMMTAATDWCQLFARRPAESLKRPLLFNLSATQTESFYHIHLTGGETEAQR